MARPKAPMLGRQFGRWTVIEEAPPPPYTTSSGLWYRCRCACGTERVLRGCSLRHGSTRSCGCLRTELNRERLRERREKASHD